MDKQLILNRIKLFYKLRSDAELAKFLGISTATLGNWRGRDYLDYDLIFQKVSSENLMYFLTGKENTSNSSASDDFIQYLKSENEKLKLVLQNLKTVSLGLV